MLTRLQIQNLTIIENIELPLDQGMTVITGETGAGKSIIIDALQFALGERASADVIRQGEKQAVITMEFHIDELPRVNSWLNSKDLADQTNCIIRRIINLDGRSRHYINGYLVNQQQLRELGQLLVTIHSQHQQQRLGQRAEQRILLDDYGSYQRLLQQLQTLYQSWLQLQQRIAEEQNHSMNHAEIELLHYQLEELEQYDLNIDTIEQLQQQHKQKANSQMLTQQTQMVLHLLDDNQETSLTALARQVSGLLSQIKPFTHSANNAFDLANNISIELKELAREVSQLADELNDDPEQLQTLEEQLSQLYQLARKHKLDLIQLPCHYQTLKTKQKQLQNNQSTMSTLLTEQAKLLDEYQNLAAQLSTERTKTAAQLTPLIKEKLHQLNMSNAEFTIEIETSNHDTPSPHGNDSVSFLISMNPGQPLQPITKIASGGELSRISLAIEVITAKKAMMPLIIFDEVDTGIGGETAEVVGKLLRQLSKEAQLICITHLPQIAAQGQNHFSISKSVQNAKTYTTLTCLDQSKRIEEISRMLAGNKLSQHSLAHAESLLAAAN